MNLSIFFHLRMMKIRQLVFHMNPYQNIINWSVRIYGRDELSLNSICWKFIRTYLFTIRGHWFIDPSDLRSLIPKQMDLGDPTDPLILNLVQSLTWNVCQLDYVTIGSWFVLFSLSLCSNWSKKQIRKNWPENSHESFYYSCSLRVNFYGGVFHICNQLSSPQFLQKKNDYICLL